MPLTLFNPENPVLGEDTWELFEAIESSFEVDLGDYGPRCGMTVRELAEEIRKQAAYPSADKCLTAVSFYRLRRALQSFGFPRGSIRPATPLRELLPWRSRRSQWQMLRDRIGLKMPGLAFPLWGLRIVLVAPAAILTLLVVFNVLRPAVGSLLLLYVVFLIASFGLLLSLARAFPREGETCGGLAKLILAKNYAIFARQNGSSPQSDDLWSLRQLIAMEIGVSVEDVSPSARIPQDLNIY